MLETFLSILGCDVFQRVRCTNVNEFTNNGTCSARCFVFLLWWKSCLTDPEEEPAEEVIAQQYRGFALTKASGN